LKEEGFYLEDDKESKKKNEWKGKKVNLVLNQYLFFI
jgi:hypothetical protein